MISSWEGTPLAFMRTVVAGVGLNRDRVRAESWTHLVHDVDGKVWESDRRRPASVVT